MAERKQIPKRIRFEVFKRDKFTCQYCGRMAPDVVLQVDHIKPVSKGGTNDILNLITSCFDCNNGKSNIELSDDTVVKKQQEQLKLIAEHKEQIEMMFRWKEGLMEIEKISVDAISKVFSEKADSSVSEKGRCSIRKWIREFSFNDVLDAAIISIDAYYDGTQETAEKAFNMIPGICYNKRRGDNKELYYSNYTIKSLRSKNFRCDPNRIKEFMKAYVHDDADFDLVKYSIYNCTSLENFWTIIHECFDI